MPKPEPKGTALSATMRQAALASELEELDPPCYGDRIDCDCGKRLCVSNTDSTRDSR